MRILFTSAGGHGHTDPLLPIARAARTNGHTVAFCCRQPMAESIEAEGYTAFTAGPAIPILPEIAPLAPIDSERERQSVRDHFAHWSPGQRATETRELFEAWQPDVVVCDETDFGALVASDRLDIPYATVAIIAAGSFLPPAEIAEPLNDLRAAHGLDPDPQLGMLTRYLGFVPGPPRFRDPAFPLAPTAHPVRPAVLDAPDTPLTPLGGNSGTTTVYVTLGTVFNMESGDLFERVLAGVRDLPFEVVVTVGFEIDPTTFGAQPPNISITRYIPLASVLSISSVVVSHGGSGTVLGALAYGLPSVLVPMGADQPFNAARCESLGVARVLDALTCTPLEVHDAVTAVLSDPTYRDCARHLRDETRALPGPAYCVALLERLAAERGPIILGA